MFILDQKYRNTSLNTNNYYVVSFFFTVLKFYTVFRKVYFTSFAIIYCCASVRMQMTAVIFLKYPNTQYLLHAMTPSFICNA